MAHREFWVKVGKREGTTVWFQRKDGSLWAKPVEIGSGAMEAIQQAEPDTWYKAVIDDQYNTVMSLERPPPRDGGGGGGYRGGGGGGRGGADPWTPEKTQFHACMELAKAFVTHKGEAPQPEWIHGYVKDLYNRCHPVEVQKEKAASMGYAPMAQAGDPNDDIPF